MKTSTLLLGLSATAVATVTFLTLTPNSPAAEQQQAQQAPPLDMLNPPKDIGNGDRQSSEASKLIGSYTGVLGSFRTTLVIDRVIGSSVTGYSICEGNERAFTGSWAQEKGALKLTLTEPGDVQTDGKFLIAYQPEAQKLTGTWIPNRRKIGKAAVDLERREFKYDTSVGNYPESSTRLLKVKEVENLNTLPLKLMRSEIYARHGYVFTNPQMKAHFEQQSWYMPFYLDVREKLTDIEKKNEELIKRYENYRAEYGDRFGR